MANLIAAIDNVMTEWRALRINNRQAYEQINKLILDFQRLEWDLNHQ